MQLSFITASEIRALLSPARATEAITKALEDGLEPDADTARGITSLSKGQFLMMPAEALEHTGVKVATVAPANPSLGLPRVQGLYLIFDSATLTPQAVLDGTALTALRTPAVSVAAVLPVLAQRSTPLKLAVFGAGRQAVGHVETIAGVMQGKREIERVTYIVRNPERTNPARPAISHVVGLGTPEADAAVAAADIVVCATSAGSPLFNSSALKSDVIVIAVGSHEPHLREVDAALFQRAQVVVEDTATALRESGDVVLAITECALTPQALIPMKDVITGAARLDPTRPTLFKSSGMSWEDLVIAKTVVGAFLQKQATQLAARL